MRAAAQRRNGLRITFPQMLILLGLVFGVWFLSSFSRMMDRSHTIRNQESQLLVTVTALYQEQAGLKLTQAYVSSDAFGKNVLRNKMKYGLPGETHIVVITPAVETGPQTTVTYADVPPPHTPNWLVWRDLFFAPNN